VIRGGLTGSLWWLLARLRLCLAGIDELEVRRLLLQRTRWILLTAGGAAFLVALGGTLRTEIASQPALWPAPAREAELALYGAAAALGLVTLVLWRYSQAIVRRARSDRSGTPGVCRGTVRWIVTAQDGGWPVLIRRDDGRWLWLTGNPAALALVRSRLARTGGARGYRLTITLVYHRRSRVIERVTGTAVVALQAAWQSSREIAADRA
jgi:hypothetical protein